MKIHYQVMDPDGGTYAVMAPIARELRALGHEVTVGIERQNDSIPLSDLVHFWNLSGKMAALGRPLVPSVVTLHHLPLQQEEKYVHAMKHFRPDRIHVVDPWAVRQLGRHGIYNVELIPQALDRIYTPEPLPAEFTVGYLGNGDSGLKRFSVIEAAAQELGFQVAGHSNPPWIPREQITDLFKRMSVFVCASFEEGGPVPVIEALQMGRPIVTTLVGNAALYVREGFNGRLFKGDKASLKVALLRVKEELDWLSDNAGQTYTLAPIEAAAAYETMYEEVLDEN